MQRPRRETSDEGKHRDETSKNGHNLGKRVKKSRILPEWRIPTQALASEERDDDDKRLSRLSGVFKSRTFHIYSRQF